MELLTPTQVAILVLGTRNLVAEVCGVSGSAVTQWGNASRARAAGDIPSIQYIRRILARPEAQGLDLEHLIRGATQAEIDAILAARAQGATPEAA